VVDRPAVAVLTELAGLDRPFDYLAPEAVELEVGDQVRVDLQGRSVRGWVLGPVPASPGLKSIRRRLGIGPPASVVELCAWAARRWHGPRARLLVSASPDRLVRELPVAPAPGPGPAGVGSEPGVIALSPTTDPLGIVLDAYARARERGASLLVLVPSEAWAERLSARLVRRGLAVAVGEDAWSRARAGWPIVVGARGAAFSPLARLGAAVVVDADDESYRSEATPTWDATAVVAERCRRDGAAFFATSMMPSPALWALGEPRPMGLGEGGWPRVVVADRRERDPRDGALTRVALEAAHRALASDEEVAVAVILQRLGRGRLLTCRRCAEIVRCAQCQRPAREVDGGLSCAVGHETRPPFCLACGATGLRALAVGVSALAREVAGQLGQAVSEVDARSARDAALARVVVGTEAVLSRVRRAALVVVADVDQYLLAPRESARRRAVEAVGRAGRLVGGRQEGRGEIVVQTRRGDDPVVRALVDGDVMPLAREDDETARLLGLPPYGALAELSGPGAPELAASLRAAGVSVGEGDGVLAARADDLEELLRALDDAPRAASRVRVALW
jgi:primosomal protein N' (replication factor Y)